MALHIPQSTSDYVGEWIVTLTRSCWALNALWLVMTMGCWEYVQQASFMQRIGVISAGLVMLSAVLAMFHYGRRPDTRDKQLQQDVPATSEEESPQDCTSAFDFSLVNLDVKWEMRDVFESRRCVVQLLYGRMVVGEWHGSSENGEENGVVDACLSKDKATLTLSSADGRLSMSVSEFVAGALLGAGCPEPPKHLQQGSRRCREKLNTKHIIEELGCSESAAVEARSVPTKSFESGPSVAIPKGGEELGVADLPSPCRRRRLRQGPLLVA